MYCFPEHPAWPAKSQRNTTSAEEFFTPVLLLRNPMAWWQIGSSPKAGQGFLVCLPSWWGHQQKHRRCQDPGEWQIAIRNATSCTAWVDGLLWKVGNFVEPLTYDWPRRDFIRIAGETLWELCCFWILIVYWCLFAQILSFKFHHRGRSVCFLRLRGFLKNVLMDPSGITI